MPPPETSRMARIGRRAVGPAVVVAVLGLQASAIHRQSLSGDGAQHLLAGQHALFHGQILHNLEHPPLVKLVAALPAANRRYNPETGREVLRQYCRGEATLMTGDRLAHWEERLLDLERDLPLVAQMAAGVLGVAVQDSIGVYPAYAFGEVSSKGRWWYFPAAFLVRTPLVLLAVAGALALGWLWRRSRKELAGWPGWEALPLVATVILYLWMAMGSNYNIGLRHLLPVLPLLYLPLALGLARRPRWAAAAGVTLLAETAAVAPNWVAATNTWWLGERNPTRFSLGAGDMEFRQNLWWLAEEARRRDLENLGVLYFGLREEVLHAYLPGARVVRPGEPLPPGWYVVNVAVEQLIPGVLRGDPEKIHQYRELRPIALEWRRVWRRIRSGEDHGWVAGTFHLYRIPPPEPSPPGPLSRPLPPPAHRERGKEEARNPFLLFSLFSRCAGGGRGREKRAGVMRG